MRSRMIREGSVGLLILVGLGLIGGLTLWIRGFDPTKRAYRFTIEFTNIAGMELGAPVRYRGVAVGKTVGLTPGANVVGVEVEVRPATLRIPKDALIQVIQTGLIGETYVDISPNVELPSVSIATDPLATECDSDIVVCNGDRLEGYSGVSFSELIGSVTRFTDLFSDPEVVGEIRTLTRNSADAADGVADLSREVSILSQLVRQELGSISDAATGSVASVGRAADTIALTATQVDELITTNRSAIVSTLNNINQTSRELQTVLGGLSPMLSESGGIMENLESLSVNAVEASNNLRNLSAAVGSPENLLLLQQTLDSARSTFQNAQKITADLDELTGDPSFRNNVRDLIDSLNNLVSATQHLEQRAQLAQMLDSADIALQSSEWRVTDPADRSAPPAQAQTEALVLPMPETNPDSRSRTRQPANNLQSEDEQQFPQHESFEQSQR